MPPPIRININCNNPPRPPWEGYGRDHRRRYGPDVELPTIVASDGLEYLDPDSEAVQRWIFDKIRSWEEGWEYSYIQPPAGMEVYDRRYVEPTQPQLAYHLFMPNTRALAAALCAALREQNEDDFLIDFWDWLVRMATPTTLDHPPEPFATDGVPWSDDPIARFNCGCARPHCEWCHPDGPPDWCTCDVCHPPRVDDQDNGVDDDFRGLPSMPEPARRRCRFGIEIEFNSPPSGEISRRQVATVMVRRGIAAQALDYTHNVVPFWKLIYDASVSGGEAVSPVLDGSDRSLLEVREVMRIIKEQGGVTGNNCGMHVHLDITGFRHAQLVTLGYNLERAETALAAFVPAGRRGRAAMSRWAHNPQAYDSDRSAWPDASESGDSQTGFCRLIRPDEWERVQTWIATIDPTEHARTRMNRSSGSPLDRNVSFNFNAVMSYGTVECRLLGYTLNTLKVRAWVRALQTVIYMSQRRIEMPGGDFVDILCEHGLSDRDADTFRQVVDTRGTADLLAIT